MNEYSVIVKEIILPNAGRIETLFFYGTTANSTFEAEANIKNRLQSENIQIVSSETKLIKMGVIHNEQLH